MELASLAFHSFHFVTDIHLLSCSICRYVDVMNGCLLQQTFSYDPVLVYDHRYFYIKGHIGHYTCGLAREVMARILREKGEDIFLRPEWFSCLDDFKNNPSVLGFCVEHMCLSSISQMGLNAAGLGFHNMKTIIFSGSYPEYDMSHELALYIPSVFNFKAIDGLILHLAKTNAESTAHLVPIQITIAKDHSKSEDTFFANWDMWIRKLANYKIKTTFLWILEEKRDQAMVEMVTRNMRSGNKQLNPNYTKVQIAVEDVNKEIGHALQRARNQ